MRTTSRPAPKAWSFLVMVFVFQASSVYGSYVHLEDFEDDTLGNTVGGYDSGAIHHFVGSNFFVADDTFSSAIPPSPHHQLFMGAETTDAVSIFVVLTDYVDHISLWMTGTGGGMASAEFMDASFNVVRFETVAQDAYQFFDTAGSGLGNITSFRLNVPPALPGGPGMEALYDDIAFYVVPEPSTFIVSAAGLTGLVLLARQGRARRLPR